MIAWTPAVISRRAWLLRTPVIVRLLAVPLVAATALLATGVALGAPEAGWGAQAALLTVSLSPWP